MLKLFFFDGGVEASRGQMKVRHCARFESILVARNGCNRLGLVSISIKSVRSHDARMPQSPLSNEVAAELLPYTHNEADASGLTYEIEI